MKSIESCRLKSLFGPWALALATTLFLGEAVMADPGDPVAIRRSGGCFVIESMWDLSLQIVTDDQFRSTPMAGVDLLRHETETPSLAFRFRQDAKRGGTLDHTLDRPANVDTPTWTPTGELSKPTPNAIRVRSEGSVIVIDVDGVRITYIDNDAGELNESERRLTKETNALIVGPRPQNTISGDAASKSGRQIESDVVVIGADESEIATGNLLVIRAGHPDKAEERKTVRLDAKPLTLPVEIEKLMMAKEAACRASQEVFAELTTNQMNFRPSNGSHTPRWNSEHMMGRELLFFSQIYSAQDAAIPVIDLNPKQMPPDYVARHPNWTGKEEARQMQRVSSFTSRYAHLLKDLPLDEKAPGSNWTLRGLLRQMERHYNEHTANVKKKFELNDWPAE